MTALEPRNIVRPLPLRVDDFLLLNDTGAFADYGKTELIDGGIVYMNAQHRPHARVKANLYRALCNALEAAKSPFTALIEVTVSMPPHNAPEPDIVLTNEPEGEGPVPLSSIALIVEVSDTTLKGDLGIKQHVYARHGVPEYWVADVEGRVIHQMWGPSGEGYAERREHAFGAVIEVATLAGALVATGGLD